MLTNYYILIIPLDILQNCPILKYIQNLKYQPFFLTEYRGILICNRNFILVIYFIFSEMKMKNLLCLH